MLVGPPSSSSTSATTTPFTHTFDLTKRLTLPSPTSITTIALSSSPSPSTSPYTPILTTLHSVLASTTTSSTRPPIRLIIPSLLSPALYPPHASLPAFLLPFLHSLRSLLRLHPRHLSLLISIPLSLHPRSAGLVRMAEHVCDAVVELTPFPHSTNLEPATAALGKGGGGGAGGGGGGGEAWEEQKEPQGLVALHKLPVISDRGAGLGVAGADDLAFTVSRRRFVIGAFALPPVQADDREAQAEGGTRTTKADLEF
jgi:elongator complex protein 4